MHVKDEKAVRRINVLTQHYLLSVGGLSGAGKGSSELRALVCGLVTHHLSGRPGLFNGRDSVGLFEAVNKED